MFVVKNFIDKIQILPSELGEKDIMNVLKMRINREVSNRILSKEGLVVRVHRIISYENPYVHPGEKGTIHLLVKFALLIFKPFEGEVIQGTIENMTKEDGIFLSLEFFNDILISKNHFLKHVVWNGADRFTFKADPEDLNDSGVPLAIGQMITFRVVSVELEDINGGKGLYVIGAIDEEGLGIRDWWEEDE